ncbi:MAG: PLP-dependent aminotransferase family protein [Granulosicoccaceae bacterium]
MKESFLYEQVADQVGSLVSSGALGPGDRVPSLRVMSRKYKVSIATVMQAYMQLESKGLIESRPQSGFFVREARGLPQPVHPQPEPRRPRKVQFGNTVETIFALANQRELVPLGVANPAASLLPVRGLSRALRTVVSKHADEAVSYNFPPGVLALRRQLALRHTGIAGEVDPDQILITNGATEGLMVALQAVAQAGDIIAVAAPTYFNVLQMIERLGMLALEVPTQADTGICLEALDAQLRKRKIAAVVLSANFSNPTGALMPEAAKSELVQMVERHQVPLIEDDVFGDLSFEADRPRMCKAYDKTGNVITVSSFSKTLAPGFRVGWVFGGRHHLAVMQQKQLNSSATSSLTQLAVAAFLAEGNYDRHLVSLRRAYRRQVGQLRAAIAAHFPEGTRVSDPQGGFVTWVQVPGEVDTQLIYQQALRRGVSITPGFLFSTTGRYRQFMRLCAGHPWNENMTRGVATLGEVVKQAEQTCELID